MVLVLLSGRHLRENVRFAIPISVLFILSVAHPHTLTWDTKAPEPQPCQEHIWEGFLADGLVLVGLKVRV